MLRVFSQVLHVEVKESTNNRTEAPCSFLIDETAEMEMPTEVHFQGVDTDVHGMGNVFRLCLPRLA